MRISRRQALQIPLVSAVVVAAGCGRREGATPRPPDPFIALAEDASYDATDARLAATRFPDRADELNLIADERAQHAEAIRAEIRRLSTATSSAASSTDYASAFYGDVGALRDSIAKSGQRAAAAARNTHGYRAGLLASISAACAVHTEVLLA